ncbi:MAG: DNA repair protein RecO [Minisyncoccia bacterium]
MSYTIHTTPALVLSSQPYREADRLYSLLTKELGLIRASAQGVRKEHSKLRGSLEPISLSTVSFVKGKEFWRITSSSVDENISIKLSRDKKLLKAISQALALLERMVQGETPHGELFDALEKLIKDAVVGGVGDTKEFETKLVATILADLGYLNKTDLTLGTKELIKAINHGLEASQLS